jgi:glutamate synthase domain-containing protein 1
MVLYFAYGSNMLEKQMLERGCLILSKTKGILYDFEFKFNKKSIDGTGKANIQQKEMSTVEGVVFEINSICLLRVENKEKGYHKQSVQISSGENILNCITFVADKTRIDDHLKPSKEYKEKIVHGAKENQLSERYIVFLEKIEVC